MCSIIQAHDPAHQITPKFETTINAINLISTHAKRVHKHDSYLSPTPRNHFANTSGNFNNLKYAYLASQIPINNSLAKQNTTHYKQSFQNQNELSLAKPETHFTNSKFPPIWRISTNISRSHHPKIEPMFFALSHLKNQSPIPKSNNPLNFKHTLKLNYINRHKNSMPSKKRITRVWFTDASRTANQPSTPPTTSRPAVQLSNSPSNTRAASSTQIITPTPPALSSNASTPLTPSPQIPTFDHIINKIFSKSLIASLTSRDAVVKEIRDCKITNNESRLKAVNPYIHSYWRVLHVRSGCVCV